MRACWRAGGGGLHQPQLHATSKLANLHADTKCTCGAVQAGAEPVVELAWLPEVSHPCCLTGRLLLSNAIK